MTVPTNKGGLLARLAAQLCGQPAFQRWIGASAAEDAAETVRVVCQVASRAQLDHSRSAAALFHKHIRGPWLKGAPFKRPEHTARWHAAEQRTTSK
jgi:hypothetical protein